MELYEGMLLPMDTEIVELEQWSFADEVVVDLVESYALLSIDNVLDSFDILPKNVPVGTLGYSFGLVGLARHMD